MAPRPLRTGLSWREVLTVYWALVAVWAVSALVLLGVVLSDAAESGTSACSLPGGGSVEGTAHWSWSSLATVCRWNLESTGPFEQAPGAARWAVVGALAGWGLALLFLGSLLFDLTDRARARTARRLARTTPGR